jgi:hypothetical protein
MPQYFSRFARPFATLVGVLMLAGCGGGGSGGTPGGGGNPPPPPPPGGGSTITVSGRVTFDRLPFQSTAELGLNAAAPVVSPAREVVVQAMSGTTVSSSTTTDSNGNYSLSVPANSNVFIRVRAQMLKEGSAPTWNFTVKNNTNSDAVYALDGDSFATGTSNITRDLHAPSGWTGTTYNDSGRLAAPFAILDTVYRTKQLILGAAPSAALPPLNLYWSTQNRTDNGVECSDGDTGCVDEDPFCPDRGNIGTSFYFNDPSNQTTDRCAPNQALPAGIYILGAYGSGRGDTDEFDAHVIAHEFGHYFEDRFSRSDSIGGEHLMGDELDLRVAFGEGWGNAFAAMSLNDPAYRDSGDGISSDFGFNLETGSTVNEGWYSEASVGEILWDIFDTTAESGDTVTLGFGPIYDVMTDEQVNTDAFTSIFSFTSALRANNAGQSSGIAALLQREEISGSGEFGSGEGNDGGDIGFGGVYRDITPGVPVNVCSTTSASGNAGGNKLGNRQFLRFQKAAAGPVTITANGVAVISGSTPAEDPDIFVFRRGSTMVAGQSEVARQEIIANAQLDAGTYVLEVYDFRITNGDESGSRCMNVSIQSN